MKFLYNFFLFIFADQFEEHMQQIADINKRLEPTELITNGIK